MSIRKWDHPRWSQAKERRLGEILETQHPDVQRVRRSGQPLLGYGSLRKNF